ncbi:MAG: hypothetical protein BWY85_02048 [Firmicutes bacterium ADurb.Bin506]|nr:MAG: hypothetical protein BWY85_02048 [Firmicutes bacterium ADurb.Bin506]
MSPGSTARLSALTILGISPAPKRSVPGPAFARVSMSDTTVPPPACIMNCVGFQLADAGSATVTFTVAEAV